MLFINPADIKIRKAKWNFEKQMPGFVEKRISLFKKNHPWHWSRVKETWNDNLKPNLEEILNGNPIQLLQLSKDYNRLSSSKSLVVQSSLLRFVKYTFNYDYFTIKAKNPKTYDAYQLAAELDIRTCIYCNRNYTVTIVSSFGKKITRPEFDHYFAKGDHPLLAISFFNLIPCCSVCNSVIKQNSPMSLRKYAHPYLNNFVDDIKFTYFYSATTHSGLKINATALGNLKASNTLKLFEIEEVYNGHISELEDLLKIRRYFSDRYLDISYSYLNPTFRVSFEEMYRILFGVEYNSSHFHNRPFSKFKRDILEELGIV